MKTIGYYGSSLDSGQTAELENLKVPALERALYFGDGIYDATYSLGGGIAFLDEHLERFFRSASLVRMEFEFDKGALAALLKKLVSRVESEDALFVYWQASRGSAMRGHDFPANARPNLLVMIYPQNLRDNFKPLQLITIPDTRFFHCNIKTLNLLPNVLAHQAAHEAGCAEAVFHREGRVTECASSNVHILKEGILRTAPADNLILPGICRSRLLKMAASLGIPVCEEPFTLSDLRSADEILVTSAGTLCASADRLDGLPVGGKAPALLNPLREAMISDFEANVGCKIP